MPCFFLPRMLECGPSFYRILSVASDAPVRGTGFTPGGSSPGASAVLLSAPDAPIRAVVLSYSLRCLGCSSPWPRVHPRTIQSGELVPCCIPLLMLQSGPSFIVFSPLPQMLRSVAPGPPLDDPVRGPGPCSTPPWMLQSSASFCRILSVASDAPVRGTLFTPGQSSPGLVPCVFPPRMLQSGASFYRILSVASDAPVRGPGFTSGRSSPGASAVLHSAPDAPIRGVFLSYSVRCLERSSPWHRVHPRTIQSGG